MLNKKNQTIVKTVSYILLIIIAIYCVFPFIWMVISSFKPKDEIRTAIPSFVIHAPTLENTQYMAIIIRRIYETVFTIV